jgi:hypothetical protein
MQIGSAQFSVRALASQIIRLIERKKSTKASTAGCRNWSAHLARDFTQQPNKSQAPLCEQGNKYLGLVFAGAVKFETESTLLLCEQGNAGS